MESPVPEIPHSVRLREVQMGFRRLLARHPPLAGLTRAALEGFVELSVQHTVRARAFHGEHAASDGKQAARASHKGGAAKSSRREDSTYLCAPPSPWSLVPEELAKFSESERLTIALVRLSGLADKGSVAAPVLPEPPTIEGSERSLRARIAWLIRVPIPPEPGCDKPWEVRQYDEALDGLEQLLLCVEASVYSRANESDAGLHQRADKPATDSVWIKAADWRARYGIKPDRLRKAFSDGRLKQRKYIGKLPSYCKSEVMALWPEDFRDD